jgi:hypothetical protein
MKQKHARAVGLLEACLEHVHGAPVVVINKPGTYALRQKLLAIQYVRVHLLFTRFTCHLAHSGGHFLGMKWHAEFAQCSLHLADRNLPH